MKTYQVELVKLPIHQIDAETEDDAVEKFLELLDFKPSDCQVTGEIVRVGKDGE